MSECLLQAIDLTIGYPARKWGAQAGRVVLEGVNAQLRAGELVCLAGPNGAGKSTLLRALCGLQPPLAGRVMLLGRDTRSLSARAIARHLSLVLTERVDVGNLTVFDLVLLGRYPFTNWLGQVTPRDELTAWESLGAVGIEHLARRSVLELSDGERQKALLARALAQQPRILILDEPTAFLDLPHRIQMMHLLRRLARADPPRAVALSTHDLDLALRVADVIWLLPAGGPLQIGAPEDLVLSGAFDAAFSRHDIRFDPAVGVFQQDAPRPLRAGVIGHGLQAVWTQRALERLGFEVRPDAPIQVELLHKHGRTRWRLSMGNCQTDHDSIYDLSKQLDQLLNDHVIDYS